MGNIVSPADRTNQESLRTPQSLLLLPRLLLSTKQVLPGSLWAQPPDREIQGCGKPRLQAVAGRRSPIEVMWSQVGNSKFSSSHIKNI